MCGGGGGGGGKTSLIQIANSHHCSCMSRPDHVDDLHPGEEREGGGSLAMIYSVILSSVQLLDNIESKMKGTVVEVSLNQAQCYIVSS